MRESKAKSKKLLFFAVIILILIGAFVYSLKGKTNRNGVLGKISRVVYQVPETIDCQEKFVQKRDDFLANMLNDKVSVEDCIFTGCSQFFF
ncbi:MAG: hypothetical protein Q8P25_00820 [Candidatus Curtissbacteria bacterium]|nr:hypothetical protein [Candidatus Curtissbacteria bacterium]